MDPKEQYMLNFFDSLHILQGKRDELKRAATSAKLTDSERAAAAAAFLDMTARIGEFEDAHEALMRKFLAGTVIPDKALVDKTQEIETKLAEIIVKRKELSAMLKAVTGVITAWSSLGGGDGKAAAGPKAADKVSHLEFVNPS